MVGCWLGIQPPLPLRLLTGAGIAHQQHVHLASNVAAARLLPLHTANQLRMAADKRATNINRSAAATRQMHSHGLQMLNTVSAARAHH